MDLGATYQESWRGLCFNRKNMLGHASPPNQIACPPSQPFQDPLHWTLLRSQYQFQPVIHHARAQISIEGQTLQRKSIFVRFAAPKRSPPARLYRLMWRLIMIHVDYTRAMLMAAESHTREKIPSLNIIRDPTNIERTLTPQDAGERYRRRHSTPVISARIGFLS